jgi:hypothetical protein
MLSWSLHDVRGLPAASSASCLESCETDTLRQSALPGRTLTVVALSDAVLYPAPFVKIQDLGPVFVGIRICAGSAAGAVSCEIFWVALTERRTVDEASMFDSKTLLVERRC